MKFKFSNGFWAGLILIAGCMVNVANAGIIDFTDNNTPNVTEFSDTITGVGLDVGTNVYFSNAIDEAANSEFWLTSDGLGLGSGGIGYSFDVLFDQTVSMTEISVSASVIPPILGFDINGLGVSVQDLLVDAVVDNYILSTPITFIANETYTFTSNNLCSQTNCGALVFDQWTFENDESEPEPVPEPVSLVLLSLGLAGLGFSRKRKLHN